ncbi:MAG: hypothetical protein HC880_14190 [Bacteroidia bacterium]|nr:hypothetical protein [Bacteroidia bacterium]
MYCPLQPHCVAYQEGRQLALPVKSAKAPLRERVFHYLVVQAGGQLAMKPRNTKDIWQGLYDFWLIEDAEIISGEGLIAQSGLLTFYPALFPESEPLLHTQVLTHQRILARFWHIRLETNPDPNILQNYQASRSNFGLPKKLNKFPNQF